MAPGTPRKSKKKPQSTAREGTLPADDQVTRLQSLADIFQSRGFGSTLARTTRQLVVMMGEGRGTLLVEMDQHAYVVELYDRDAERIRTVGEFLSPVDVVAYTKGLIAEMVSARTKEG